MRVLSFGEEEAEGRGGRRDAEGLSTTKLTRAWPVREGNGKKKLVSKFNFFMFFFPPLVT